MVNKADRTAIWLVVVAAVGAAVIVSVMALILSIATDLDVDTVSWITLTTAGVFVAATLLQACRISIREWRREQAVGLSGSDSGDRPGPSSGARSTRPVGPEEQRPVVSNRFFSDEMQTVYLIGATGSGVLATGSSAFALAYPLTAELRVLSLVFCGLLLAYLALLCLAKYRRRSRSPD